jgi:hypothetical protein
LKQKYPVKINKRGKEVVISELLTTGNTP